MPPELPRSGYITDQTLLVDEAGDPIGTSPANPLHTTGSGGGGGAVTIADGADVTQGAIADAAVTGDNAGTQSAKLRGVNKTLGEATDAAATTDGSLVAILKRVRDVLQDVWDSVNGRLIVDGSQVTQPVSGSVTVSGSVSVSNLSEPLDTESADGAHATIGATTDAEATSNGSLVALLKRLRTLLAGGLPAALVGGRLDVNVGNTPTVAGGKTSNGGAPGATNLGTLPAIATAAAPSYTEGNQVGLSVNLAGELRTEGGGGGGASESVNGTINVSGTSLTVKWSKINATASGDNTVLTAVTSMKLRILGIAFTCSNNVEIVFKSGSNTLIDAMSFAKYGGLAENSQPGGRWAETNAGEAFIMNLDGAVNVRGRVYYVEVP